MVNERQTDTCADVMYRRERQRGCGEAGLDFAPFIPSQDEVDQQMSALDDKLVSKAQEQYANREIYPFGRVLSVGRVDVYLSRGV